MRTIKKTRRTIYHVGDKVQFWAWSGDRKPTGRGEVVKVRYRYGQREHLVKFDEVEKDMADETGHRWLEAKWLRADWLASIRGTDKEVR